MENKNISNPEERAKKEKEEIAKENKILSFLLPIVGGIALLFGVVGFILTVTAEKIVVGALVFLAFLALIGAAGVGYGVFLIIKAHKEKRFKKEKNPQ